MSPDPFPRSGWGLGTRLQALPLLFFTGYKGQPSLCAREGESLGTRLLDILSLLLLVKWRRNFSCFLGRCICCFIIWVDFMKGSCGWESEEGRCVNCCLRTYQSSCRSFYLRRRRIIRRRGRNAVLPISISISDGPGRSSDDGVLFR